jgi:hypothetical protein
MTVKLGETSDLTLGLSGMGGTYDPSNDLTYVIAGGDATLRLDKTTLRAEYLGRRQQFDTSDKSRFKYVVEEERGDFFMKHGTYLEVEQALSPEVDLIGRVDGLYRVGNVEAASELSRKSYVFRYTVGTAWAFEQGIRLKLSTELWEFSDRDATSGRKLELSAHAGVAGSF